eukprot:5546867-Pyramimonas_sp.AAC.2
MYTLMYTLMLDVYLDARRRQASAGEGVEGLHMRSGTLAAATSSGRLWVWSMLNARLEGHLQLEGTHGYGRGPRDITLSSTKHTDPPPPGVLV